MWILVVAMAAGAVAGSPGSPAEVETTWVSVSLDDRGQVIGARVPGLVSPFVSTRLRDWIRSESFRPVIVDGRPVGSTQWVRVVYRSEETAAGFDLEVLRYDPSPIPLATVEPEYPPWDLAAGREGWATVCFTIEATGRVANTKVSEATKKSFAKASMEAIQKWKFKPRTMVDGEPVPMEACQTIEFKMGPAEAAPPAEPPAADTASGLLAGRAWLDLALDERGEIIDAVVVDEVQPALVEPVKSCLQDVTFEPAAVDGYPVPSTTSAWVEYMLYPTDAGYELYCTDYGDGPRPIHQIEPRYPRGDLLAGRPGGVELQLTIDGSGRVTKAAIIEATNPDFGKAALRAVRKWRFQPKTVNGKGISMDATQTIEFVPPSRDD